MKRRLILGLLCLLLVCGGIAIGGYVYLFHNLDEESKTQINQEIGTINDQVKEQIQEEKDRLKEAQEDGASSEEESEETTGGELLSGGAASVVTSGVESLTKRSAAIVNIYYGGMKELEGQGNAIVNQLLSNAKADYKRITDAGGGKDQLTSLASSYSNQASAMESGIDASVEGLLAQMKSDLIAEGVSSQDAKKIVSQLRSEYKAKKKARYNEVYAQFQAALK